MAFRLDFVFFRLDVQIRIRPEAQRVILSSTCSRHFDHPGVVFGQESEPVT